MVGESVNGRRAGAVRLRSDVCECEAIMREPARHIYIHPRLVRLPGNDGTLRPVDR